MAERAPLIRAIEPVTVLGVAVVASEALSRIVRSEWITPADLGKAAVSGCAAALFVTGLVLVYRAVRIINFAHAAVGYLAVMLYLLLRVMEGWSFWVVTPLVLGGAAVLGVLIDLVVVRRFTTAPRLVLTVATIALGQFLVGIALALPGGWGLKIDDPTRNPLPPFVPSTPVGTGHWKWGNQVFFSTDAAVVIVSVVLLGALAGFLRYSRVGIAIRGAAENRARAAMLGVRVNDLSAVVWAIAAFFAVAGALVLAIAQRSNLNIQVGAGVTAALAGGVFLRALTAAVIGKMENLPVAIAAAFGISIVDQAVFLSYRQTAAVNAVLLGVIVVALLLQRRGFSRSALPTSGSWEAAEELKSIPRSLARLATVRRTSSRFLFVVGLFVLAFPWITSPGQTLNGSLFAIYGIVAVSLVVLTGWGGQISLGQFGFVAVGSIVGGALTAKMHLPFPVAVVAAVVAGALVAVLVGLPALRIQGLFLAVTTLGFAVVTQTVVLNEHWFGSMIPKHVTRPVFFGIDMNKDERGFYYLCLAALVLAVSVVSALRRSRSGRVLIALRDNERAAQSYGINFVRTRLSTFAIAGGLAGLAGVLYANHEFGVTAAAFGTDQSVFLFLMAVMGGLGSVYGVLLGTIYFGLTRVLLANVGGQLVASGFGVFVILLFFPGGLGALAYRVRDSWLRRVALRYRIFVPSLLGVDRRLDGEVAPIPIAARPEELEPVPRRYRRESLVVVSGSSQQARAWRE